jgi:hypothetical protein
MHALGADITDRTSRRSHFPEAREMTRIKCVTRPAEHVVVVHMAHVWPSADY